MPSAVIQMSEADLQAAVIDLAHLLKYRVAHFGAAQNGKGNWRTPVVADGAGWPDLILVRERLLVVELKSAKGRLSPEQLDWMAALSNAEVEVHCWRPEQWADGSIQTVLERRR